MSRTKYIITFLSQNCFFLLHQLSDLIIILDPWLPQLNIEHWLYSPSNNFDYQETVFCQQQCHFPLSAKINSSSIFSLCTYFHYPAGTLVGTKLTFNIFKLKFGILYLNSNFRIKWFMKHFKLQIMLLFFLLDMFSITTKSFK